MNINLSTYNFNNNDVRIVFDRNNEPLFCLADVCKSLDIKNQNPKRFDLNIGGLHKMSLPTTSGVQTLSFISEENLYRIIFRSNKPEALSFQNWVFAEVLPTIRKTGSYTARHTAYEELIRLHMQEKVSKQKGSFHSHGMHKRKHEKHLNALRIKTCEENIQLAFEGITQ